MNLKIKFLVFSFFLLTNFVNGQKIKMVKKYIPGTWLLAEYYVLKNAPSTKHGPYKVTFDGKILEYGSYKNGIKDSLWVQFSEDQGIIINKGIYMNGLKTGIWENKSGKLRTWFNYDTNELLNVRVDQDFPLTFEVKSDNGIEKIKLDQPPLIVDAKNPEENLSKQIGSKIKYPISAMRNEIEGIVVVSFFIDKEGSPIDYFIEKGLGHGCDEEALNAVKNLKNIVFIPGVLNGQKVTAKYLMPVSFRIK